MSRILGTALLCLAVDGAGLWTCLDAESPARLEGRWQIISVQRDGRLDSTSLGATLTFTGDAVRFEHRFPEWNSVTYSIVQDQPLSSDIPSTLWQSVAQGRPAQIPDGSS